jgi:hypothetical protein
MSGKRHELTQTIEVLVLVKAYPTPSTKYTESVCVAGLRMDTPKLEWVRLYPIQYRLLSRERQFRKYDVIRLQVRRPRNDTRPESYTPIIETIETINHVEIGRAWEPRIPFIEAVKVESMCELQRRQATDDTSLGVFRPFELTKFEITPTSAEWEAGQQAALGQVNLLSKAPRTQLEKIPFDFHYSFSCDEPACNGHRMSMIDWELGENYRKTAGLADEERRRLLMERWRDRVCGPNRDTHFFAGTLAKRRDVFVLLGAFWPPKPKVPVAIRRQELALF